NRGGFLKDHPLRFTLRQGTIFWSTQTYWVSPEIYPNAAFPSSENFTCRFTGWALPSSSAYGPRKNKLRPARSGGMNRIARPTDHDTWFISRSPNRPCLSYLHAHDASAGSHPRPATKNSAQQW